MTSHGYLRAFFGTQQAQIANYLSKDKRFKQNSYMKNKEFYTRYAFSISIVNP